MGTIALLPEGRDERLQYLKFLGIPDRYMEDYSILGIVVDNYMESLNAVRDSGFIVEQCSGGARITFDHPSAVPRILNLLNDRCIHCEYKDIVDTFYQS